MFQSSAKTIRLLLISSLYTLCLTAYAQSEIVAPKSSDAALATKSAANTAFDIESQKYLKAISRGASYCVINIVQYGLFGIEIDEYSTRKLNTCNPMAYHTLTEASISAQMRTFANVKQVVKGGFHTLVASRDLNPFITPFIYLGEIQFQKHGQLNVSYLSYAYKYLTDKDFRRGLAQSSYVPLSGHNPMEYLYNPGEEVYEIVTSDGRVFVMTSFTDYINSSLSLDNLKDLGPSLSLPAGWQYRTRKADKQIVIKTSAPTYDFTGLFDEFSNYYVESK